MGTQQGFVFNGQVKEPLTDARSVIESESSGVPVSAVPVPPLADHRFLGREFLTWLIFRVDDNSEREESSFADAEGPFRVIIGERATLKAPGDGVGEIRARGPATGQVADVRYAIAGGLTVRELDLLFERNDRVWQATIAAESFDMKRVKLPQLLADDERERLTERLALISELDSMLKATYESFLCVRLSDAWAQSVVPLMRTWLADSIRERTEKA